MHTKEELDMAVIKLYNSYKDTIRDYKSGNIKLFSDLIKISEEETKYSKGEVYYIGFNALLLLENNIKKGELYEKN